MKAGFGKIGAGIFFLLLFLQVQFAGPALIYKNQGCGHCVPYLDELVPMLVKSGYADMQIKDYMQDNAARAEFYQLQERFGVPLQMQGHMAVLLDGNYLFEGHVPVGLIEEYMKNPKGPVVVTQDEMEGAKSYFMLMGGKAHECPISQPLGECIEDWERDGGKDAGNPVSGGIAEGILPFALLAVALGAVVFYTRGN